MSTNEAWFEATNLVIETGATRLSVPHLGVTTPGVALLDRAADLLPLLLQPESWSSGRVTLDGRTLSELLASGRAGYAPLALPGDERTRLGAILETSARLVGATQRDVARAAALVGLGDCLRRRMSELTRVDLRLGALAHALTTEPHFLLLDDLLVDLEPREADRVEVALDVAVGHSTNGTRSILFACHSRTKRSLGRLRYLGARREAVTVLTAERAHTPSTENSSLEGEPGGQGAVHDFVIGTSSLGSLTAKSVYLELGVGEAAAFARHANERGLSSTPLPGGHRVWVDRVDQEIAIELARVLGLAVLAVEEAHFGQ